MEKEPTKFSKRIFIVLSIASIISIVLQILAIIYLNAKGITIVSPIKWYVWLLITIASGWILYFGVIYFEPNRKAKIAFSILGLCVFLVYINAWLLIESPILWTVSIAALIILLSVAVHIFRSTSRQQSQPAGREGR